MSDEVAARHGRVTVLSPRLDRDEVVGVRYGWEDESDRLNLAVLPQWEKQVPDAANRALMCLPGMTDAAAAKILDWLDADDTVRPGGAERQQYADLHRPYGPRNGCPARIEELLLIPDVSRNLLLGREFNRDYQLASHERRRRGRKAVPPALLRLGRRCSRCTAPSGTSIRAGQPRIMLNDPDLQPALHAAQCGGRSRLGGVHHPLSPIWPGRGRRGSARRQGDGVGRQRAKTRGDCRHTRFRPSRPRPH